MRCALHFAVQRGVVCRLGTACVWRQKARSRKGCSAQDVHSSKYGTALTRCNGAKTCTCGMSAECWCLHALVQLFKILPLSSLGVGPEVTNNMSKLLHSSPGTSSALLLCSMRFVGRQQVADLCPGQPPSTTASAALRSTACPPPRRRLSCSPIPPRCRTWRVSPFPLTGTRPPWPSCKAVRRQSPVWECRDVVSLNAALLHVMRACVAWRLPTSSVIVSSQPSVLAIRSILHPRQSVLINAARCK